MGARAGARDRPRAAAGAAATDLCVRARDARPGGSGLGGSDTAPRPALGPGAVTACAAPTVRKLP